MKNRQYISFLFGTLLLIISCQQQKTATKINIEENIISQKISQKAAFIDAQKAYNIGNLEDAKTILNAIIAKDKACDACYYQLAKIYLIQKNYLEVYYHAIKAYELVPENTFYTELAAESYYNNNQKSKAAILSSRLLDSFPNTRVHYKKTYYYYINDNQQQKAEQLLIRYQNRFGYTQETALMFDNHYAHYNELDKRLANQKKLSKKYPNDMQTQKNMIIFLLDLSKWAEADTAINNMIADKANAFYGYLMQSKWALAQGNMPLYAAAITSAIYDQYANSQEVIGYLVQNRTINDTAFIAALQYLSKENPKATPFLAFYLKNTGSEKNTAQKLTEIWFANPQDYKVGFSLCNDMLAKQEFGKALDYTKKLYENHPSQWGSYQLYAKSLLRIGRFEDAYAIADNGLVYSLEREERAALYTTMAAANCYLDKVVNAKIELEKAWANLDSNEIIFQELAILSLWQNSFNTEISDFIKKVSKSNMGAQIAELQLLNIKKNIAINEWKNINTTILIKEMALRKAIAINNFEISHQLLAELLQILPQNEYYINLNKNIPK